MISKTGYAILGMLSIQPMSGYGMRKMMQESTQAFWSESDGQLYPNLAKLTQQKFITCKMPRKEGGREKKTYHITALGRTELNRWLEQAPETSLIRNEFLLKLFFGANVSFKVIHEHVQSVRYQTKCLLTQLITQKKQIAIDETESPHLPFWLMTLQYGIRLNEAKLAWCDEVLKFLKQKEETA